MYPELYHLIEGSNVNPCLYSISDLHTWLDKTSSRCLQAMAKGYFILLHFHVLGKALIVSVVWTKFSLGPEKCIRIEDTSYTLSQIQTKGHISISHEIS